MYQLTKVPFGPYTKYTLANSTNGNAFSIVPEKGANVLDILFDHQSVLEGFDTPEALTEGKWGKSTVLFPFPNRLKDGQYTWKGQTYQFPINNAATANAIHGFVRDEVFEVVGHDLREETGSITLRLSYKGQHAFYPFPFDLVLVFSLHNTFGFVATVQVTNRHTEAIPFGFGWHPYFKLTELADDHILTLPTSERVLIDDRMIPTGQLEPYTAFTSPTRIGDTSLDTCFRYSGTDDYTLSLSDGKRTLNFSAVVERWPYYQVFTPPHRTSVALEPMSCNVDGLNNGDGLVELAAGGIWQGGFSVMMG